MTTTLSSCCNAPYFTSRSTKKGTRKLCCNCGKPFVPCETAQSPVNASAVEGEFDEFAKYYAYVMSAPSELRPKALYDWFTTHALSDSTLRKVLEEIGEDESKVFPDYGDENFIAIGRNQMRERVRDIIRQYIGK